MHSYMPSLLFDILRIYGVCQNVFTAFSTVCTQLITWFYRPCEAASLCVAGMHPVALSKSQMHQQQDDNASASVHPAA